MKHYDQYARQYEARLFPLRKFAQGDANSKRPLVAGWPSAKYLQGELSKFVTEGHGVGWALSPTDLVVDVDAPTQERPTKQGLLSQSKLEDYLGFRLGEKTTSVLSPSGGKHFYFKKPSDVGIVKKLSTFPDIEFLSHGCYVVAAGSPHWQGGNYDFANACKLFDFARFDAPAPLLSLITRPEVSEGFEHTTVDDKQLTDFVTVS